MPKIEISEDVLEQLQLRLQGCDMSYSEFIEFLIEFEINNNPENK